MIGRNAEIALLSGLIAESRAGEGKAIVVHGEAGIGKSVLLAEVADAADDLLVLRVTGVEAEAELPFAVGSHLYRAYPKLGVTSRAELADIDFDPSPHRDHPPSAPTVR